MPVPWAYALFTLLLGYGSAILYNIYRHWEDPNKFPHRLNEVLYGILYYVLGFVSLTLFANDGLSAAFENTLYMYLTFGLLIFDAIWWFFNFIPNMLYCRKHPEEKANRSFQKFADAICANQKDTLGRDISRKLLHILLMGIVIGFYVFGRANEATLNASWGSYWSFCKFWYVLIGVAFCNMFTLADLVKTNKIYWIPGWANKWFSTSLTPRELYSYITSIPYILSLALFMAAPIQVLFVATVVSAVGDGAASIFGKAFGKHKFPAYLDKKKSFEGLLAGITASFLSTILIMLIFPVTGQSNLLVLAIGLSSGVLFAMIDMFARKIADNILNVILPGFATWLLLLPLL
jgi:CDP-diglyceride synthetase